MAKVNKTTNNLSKEYEYHLEKAKLFFIFSGISFLLFFPTHGLSMILCFVCFIMGSSHSNKCNVYKAGLVGEAVSESILTELPDDYNILPSIDIEFEGRRSQIDHLVVGPNGVFIVESKNVKGYITGTDEDKEITIYKTGQKGGQYQKKMYNPTKQVATHVYRTSNYLKESKLNPWVQGLVYFTNPASNVELQSNKIPVFSESEDGKKELLNYILEYEAKKILSEDERQCIVNSIMKSQKANSNNTNGSPITDFDILAHKVSAGQRNKQL